jgi:hypothetical protein
VKIKNTAYPGTNYILRMAEEKREKQGRQEEYNKKMQLIGVLALAGMIAGGIIGYYNSLEPDRDLGDVRWLGAACGAAIGMMPAAGIYYIVQIVEVLK